MASFVYGKREGTLIIDLEKTVEKLNEALNFIKEVTLSGGVILFVGTKPYAKEIVKEKAEETGMPYIVERWLGGMLTNFETVQRRINYFNQLRNLLDSEELKKYTKKERLLKEREFKKLNIYFKGVENLNKLPDAIFVIDPHHEAIAVDEANKLNIPVIALIDVDGDPDKVTYPIPGNDDTRSAIEYIVNKVAEAILNAKK